MKSETSFRIDNDGDWAVNQIEIYFICVDMKCHVSTSKPKIKPSPGMRRRDWREKLFIHLLLCNLMNPVQTEHTPGREYLHAGSVEIVSARRIQPQ